VREEQLQLLFAGLPSSLLATLLLLLLTIAVARLTGDVDLRLAIVAALAISIVTAGRFALWLAYRRNAQRENISWSTLFFVGCIAAGASWGLAAVLVFPEGNTDAQAFLAFLIAGVSAGAVTTLAAEKRAALGFVLPCVMPLAIRLLIEPGVYSAIMGVMTAMYTILISAAGLRLSQQICENIFLRLQASEQQRAQERSERALAVANHELRDLNERFMLATHSGGMGIWDWDVGADVLMWDARTYEIYGAPPDAQPSMEYMLRSVHPDDVERTRAEVLNALSGKQSQLRTTFRIICASGEERVLSASGLTLRNASGHAVRMTGLIWDITESQRVERMKNEFVATVSHELRTPLTSIRGSLGLAAAGVAGKLPERAAGLINIALNNCERLTLLINDILDIEKLESDKQRFDVRRMDVSELVTRSLEENAGLAQSLDVHFATPEPLCHADVLVDPSRFLQVMANLLSNASKFSPAGAAVEVTAHCNHGRVRVAVRDHGKGIPPEFQSRIFQKFSQADSSDSRNGTGTGLGLAISRAIVERFGGHIAFESGPAGTTFFFELPEADSVASTVAALHRSQVS
jgi:PAS domain S-box-containing protein